MYTFLRFVLCHDYNENTYIFLLNNSYVVKYGNVWEKHYKITVLKSDLALNRIISWPD